MLRRHAPPSPPAARAHELRAPHAPAPCTRAPRRTPGPAGPPRGIATGITGISGAIIGFGLPQLKRASRPGGGLSGKRMRPARPSGLAESLRDAPAHVPDCQLRSKELLRHAPPSTSGMKNAPGKRPQTDTKSPTIPAAPAIDRSPAAKVQALRNDGSDLLTPHSSRRSQNCSMRRDPPTFSRATPRRPARQTGCLILCRAKPQAFMRQ